MDSRLDPTVALTDRKVQILRFIAAGRSVREIARTLGISVSVVYEHIEAIRRRLGAHTNPELVRLGLRHGFIFPDEA